MTLDRETKRRLALFLKRSQRGINALGLAAFIILFLQYLPIILLNVLPATGGDMGSHYWPLHALFNYGFAEGRIRVWNPGNLMGEPLLVHYFPFPYFVMVFLGLFLPLGMAFNFGTLLPVLAFPLCVYWCVRSFDRRFPVPLIASAFSLFFLYNESFSMWGGNFLSVLAGQFAHMYAIDLLLLGIGTLTWELKNKRLPLASPLLFAATATSHAYVFLGVPFFFLSCVFFLHEGTLWLRFKSCFSAGILTGLLSAFYLVPMLDNAKWTTPFSMTWIFQGRWWDEVIPQIFYPAIVVLLLAPLGLRLFAGKAHRRFSLRFAGFWLLPSLAYGVFYLVFPRFGLVDVRAIPQPQLFMTILSGVLAGLLLRSCSRLASWFMAPVFVVCCLWWTSAHVSSLPGWLEWNYSGWNSKKLYPSLTELSKHIRGDFSDPRVVFEQSDLNNAAGTVRVFEMLPYFTGRATLESLYMQATILALPAYYIQALVSKTPSCPFPNVECPRPDLARVEPKLRLLAVDELILTSKEVLSQASASSYLKPDGIFGPWNLYKLTPPISLVGVLDQPPQIIEPDAWRREFFEWFKGYDGSQAMLAAPDFLPPGPINWTDARICSPELKVEFNRMFLHTDCPGRVHYLKFAFHPSFAADSGDPLFLISPGFVALTPSAENVKIEFGERRLWSAATQVSFAALVLTIVLAGIQATKVQKRRP